MMRSLIPTKKQWKNWSLPSKLTALGTLLAIITFGIYIVEKTYPVLKHIPKFWTEKNVVLTVEFQNFSGREIELYGRGDVYYWFPGESGHQVFAFEIEELAGNNDVGDIRLPENSALRGVVNLLPKEVAIGYLDQGHLSVSLYFKHKDGRATFSPTVGFTRSNIGNKYIPIEFLQPESQHSQIQPENGGQTYTHYLTNVVSDASSIEIVSGCIRLGGSFRTATEVSKEICETQNQIDGAFADSVKYIEASGCARAIIYSEKNLAGSSEEFNSC